MMNNMDKSKIINACFAISAILSGFAFFFLEVILTNSPNEYFVRRIETNFNNLPFRLDSRGEFSINGTFEANSNLLVLLPNIPRVLDISIDDCLLDLKLNNYHKKNVPPYCNYRVPFLINMPKEVQSNMFKLTQDVNFILKISNTGGKGKIKIVVKPEKSIELILRVLVLIFGCLFIYLLGWKWKLNYSHESI
jgi:hypothetical protein